MDEFVCLTLLAKPGESQAAFKTRLVAFWTHLLRTRPTDYEAVYSEAVAFEDEGGRVARRYMVAADGYEPITADLTANDIDYEPVDADDLYSKAEASSREWFQIEH